MTEDGQVTTVADVHHPAGIGFDQSGRLLISDMSQPRILRVEKGQVSTYIDLSPWADSLNDMVVTKNGDLYAGAYSDDKPFDGPHSRLLLVRSGSAMASVVAADIRFPNGVAVTPDGMQLILAETYGARLLCWDIGPEGALTNKRVWAEVPGQWPDGICLDADGAAWVASFQTGEFLRVREGGEITDRFALPGHWALSVALGGADGRSLLFCASETTLPDYLAGRMKGHIGFRRVAVPGVGSP